MIWSSFRLNLLQSERKRPSNANDKRDREKERRERERQAEKRERKTERVYLHINVFISDWLNRRKRLSEMSAAPVKGTLK